MVSAIVCGAAVGIERSINDASAGFKTQILVCVGSMLFTIAPLIGAPGLEAEQARVIAQIISGIGFLGAGAILRDGSNQVIGLTTAAWTWFTAAVGVMIGLGHGPAALFTTLALVLVIGAARKIENRMFRGRRRRSTDRPAPKPVKIHRDQGRDDAA